MTDIKTERAMIKQRAQVLCTEIGLDVRAREKIIPILMREFNISDNRAMRAFAQVKSDKRAYDQLVKKERIRV